MLAQTQLHNQRALKARIYYDFYGVGADAGQQGKSVELQADAESFKLDLLRRVDLPALGRLSEGLYFGPTMALAQIENSLRDDLDLGRLGSDLGLSSDLLDESGLPTGLDLDADTDIPRLGLRSRAALVVSLREILGRVQPLA